MASSKLIALSTYKNLLREAGKFSSYNFRMYALRRIQDAFKENKTLNDAEKVAKQFEYARKNLDIIRRQVIIGHLYSSDKLIIEHKTEAIEQ